MDEKRQNKNSPCFCQSCNAGMWPAATMKKGDLVYCRRCGASYFIDNLDPVRLIPSSRRQFGSPWQDGCEFI